jgi:hypothetical protein
MIKGDAEGRIEISGAALPGSDRKSRGGEDGASRVTARRRFSNPETLQLMEAAVEREILGLVSLLDYLRLIQSTS